MPSFFSNQATLPIRERLHQLCKHAYFSKTARPSYARIVQASAKKIHFQFAERSLTYAKLVQASAKKIYFQFAECSLTYAKLVQIRDKSK